MSDVSSGVSVVKHFCINVYIHFTRGAKTLKLAAKLQSPYKKQREATALTVRAVASI